MSVIPSNLTRVSSTLQTNLSRQSITETQAELLKVQQELSTGRRLVLPSDDAADAAIAQQLRKTLEQRETFQSNLQNGVTHLNQVDAAMGDISLLVQEAYTLAQANTGSDVTPEQRENAATVIDGIYRQLVQLANKSIDGQFVFGGDKADAPPFEETVGGVKFVGTGDPLANYVDEFTELEFMVNGEQLWGALSSRVEGAADLNPAVTASTRLSDLEGAALRGINLGSVRVDDGTNTGIVDLSGADTVGDVVDAINAAGIGSVTASVSALGINIAAGAGDTLSVQEVGAGTVAADLGILQAAPLPAGTPVTGADTRPRVTELTTLGSLNGGAGLTLAGGFTITNGLATDTIATGTLAPTDTVGDLLNLINGSSVAVRAEVNANGTGINVLNPTQGTTMTISENGGTVATQLGIRSYSTTSALADLNLGEGVQTDPAADDLSITDTAGVSFTVDLDGATTIGDVITAINAAATGAGAGVTAGFTTTGNGLTLTDTAGGGGTLTAADTFKSRALADLGLDQPAAGNVITGADVHPVEASGIFSNIQRLRDAMADDDLGAITDVAGKLEADFDRVVRIRGEMGARTQEFERRLERLEDQNVSTRSMLSELEDSDFTDAITRFQQLQTALQANLQTSAQALNRSLFDFLR